MNEEDQKEIITKSSPKKVIVKEGPFSKSKLRKRYTKRGNRGKKKGSARAPFAKIRTRGNPPSLKAR